MKPPTGGNYHLVLAADVFVYVNDLAPLDRRCRARLAPDGLFAFTVETHAASGVKLLPTLRYAHGEDLCAGVLGDAGLCPRISPKPQCAARRACRSTASWWSRSPHRSEPYVNPG